MATQRLPDLYCVRAEYGTYTEHFLKGGYVGIGWVELDDVTTLRDREQLKERYRSVWPEHSPYVIGQQVGQVARFLLEIQPGDYIITPAYDTESVHYGIVTEDPPYYEQAPSDGCPYRLRRHVKWSGAPLRRSEFSVPFQNTIRSSLTVFYVGQKDEFFQAIGKKEFVQGARESGDNHQTVLNRILTLDDKEFEILVTHLLAALGFDNPEHTGKVGDQGVDATGMLNVSKLASIKVYVQAKRYQAGAKINGNVVRDLRKSIPFGGQGAFITTADYREDAHAVAIEPGFPRIGLVNGRDLVDLLVLYWDSIPEDFKTKLGLKPGLVPAT